ncbi:MAG: THUMP domain-containing class I SAM-dependent RNA methyltransferase, partial [Acidimicrobiales bacterium]
MTTRGPGAKRQDRSAYRAAVICTPGLEDVCRQELRALGCKPKPAGPGALEMDANARQLYAANVWLRTASRVLVRMETFRSTDLGHFRRRIDAIDWDRWLTAGVAPKFRVTSNESKLYHTDAVAERLHDVAGEAAIGVDEPEQLFVVRIYRNTVTISVDSSGDALHHRPWRTALGVAPLRPTMAAAALLTVAYDPELPLADPFCGCGTIPIEAALIARDLPPGGDRDFAFRRWHEFEPGTWASVNGEISARAKAARTARPADRVEPVIAASDRDQAAIDAATGNAERAGVEGDIRFETKVVSHLAADDGAGLLITNPPFGRRVGDGDLRGLYRRFGAVVRERRPGWRLAIVSADRKLSALADGDLTVAAKFRHGGIPVQLLSRDGSE